MMEFHIRLSQDILMEKIRVRIYAHDYDRKLYVIKPIELEEVTGPVEAPPADLVLSLAGAQQMMNDMWSIGIRPSDIGSPGHLKATERHLEDMRKIAFDLLKRVGVE